MLSHNLIKMKVVPSIEDVKMWGVSENRKFIWEKEKSVQNFRTLMVYWVYIIVFYYYYIICFFLSGAMIGLILKIFSSYGSWKVIFILVLQHF